MGKHGLFLLKTTKTQIFNATFTHLSTAFSLSSVAKDRTSNYSSVTDSTFVASYIYNFLGGGLC